MLLFAAYRVPHNVLVAMFTDRMECYHFAVANNCQMIDLIDGRRLWSELAKDLNHQNPTIEPPVL